MSIVNRPEFLKTVLLIDAATCVATGLLTTLGAVVVSELTRIPSGLLMSAGLILFPIAAFMAWVAMRPEPWIAGVWLVIFGNIGWVVGSMLLLLGGFMTLNGFGYGFVLAQVVVVAILAELEIIGVRRSQTAAGLVSNR
jgi:hypothetical protein